MSYLQNRLSPFFQIPFDNGTHIFVAFHITNVSSFAQPREMDDLTADEAVDALENGADSGQPLPFQVDLGNGMRVSPVYRDRTRGRNRTDVCNTTCPTPSAPTIPPATTANPCNNNIITRLGLSDGIVAAIGIGLFFAGFFFALIFVVVCFCCCKFMKGGSSREVSSVKYKKHNNELESI